ncbi:MAG: hypothetical protein A2Y76_04445 [Planctomycetes bacterium RBG_13_60_9]|nr:MAG: hypothetical protein A2Y76_04445 [Planctomycetes bacterium RBG_13_60_9]
MFAGFGVLFTADKPAGQPYSTIYIGGEGSVFSPYGSFLGLAEQVDIGNEEAVDEAFVFSARLAETAGDVNQYAAALARLIAHEAGHLLGYEHQASAKQEEGLLERYAADGDPLRTIYVDPAILGGADASGDCLGTYDPATRSGGSGTETAYNTLMEASLVAVAGDAIVLRGGVYEGPQILRPQHSGSPGLPITYRNYGTETVTIRNTDGLSDLTQDEIDAGQTSRQYGIYIYDKSYITVQGLHVTNVSGWARIVSSDHIRLVDNDFTVALANGTTGSVKFVFSDFNEVINNQLHEGNDNLLLIHSNHNLVVGNEFVNARHALWNIRAGNYNILRGNYFYNELQKIGEVIDAQDDPPFTVDDTKHNVIEGNIFAKTASSGDASPFCGIQFAGQNCIIRNNVFYETIGPALDLTHYANEGLYNYGNRIYGNVFHETDFAGISINEAAALHDNVFKNNILAQSIFVANDTRWPWYTDDLAGKPVQLLFGRIGGFLFENNDLFNVQSGEDHLITHGTRFDGYLTTPHNLDWWQANYPAVFTGNLEADPGFVDAANHDYHLAATSPMIDTGTFLTQAAEAGSGASLRVADAGYFRDSFGLPAEPGDLIQLEGQTATARITAVDYSTNTLLLDRALTWTAGQGVSLAYEGAGPDVGAYEYAPTANRPPYAPQGTYPANGTVGELLTPTLQSSVFSDPDPGNVHGASQWQVDDDSDFSSPVWDEQDTDSDKTSQAVPSAKLSYSTAYYWRVRYQDNHGLWSEWSDPRVFTVDRYSPVYRFWKPADNTHFYTIEESEKDKLIRDYSHIYTFEGPAYYAYVKDQPPTGTLPVYRFWKASDNTHFYTIEEAEKQKLVDNYSHIYTYEGPAFYAYAIGQHPIDTLPVYRFWKASDNTHFFTIKESEKDKLILLYSHMFTFENAVWYAYGV